MHTRRCIQILRYAQDDKKKGEDIPFGKYRIQGTIRWGDHQEMADYFLPPLLPTAVQTFMSARWSEGWLSGIKSARGLENAEWCMCHNLAKGMWKFINTVERVSSCKLGLDYTDYHGFIYLPSIYPWNPRLKNSSPKLGEVSRSDGGVCDSTKLVYSNSLPPSGYSLY